MYFAELGIGISTVFLLFMLWQGFDAIVVFFMAVLIIAAVYFHYAKVTKKTFAINREQTIPIYIRQMPLKIRLPWR